MKIINVILGLGTAIIVGSLINLGIAAFYPAPVAPNYNTIVPVAPSPGPCAPGDTACGSELKQYQAQQATQQAEFTKKQEAYDAATKAYNSRFFVVANIVGIAVFAVGFLLLFSTAITAQGVPIGVMLAGFYGIIYGYARGWGSTNDQLKFFVGLLVAVLVVGGSIWLVDRYQKKHIST